jgi:hypothetical protein
MASLATDDVVAEGHVYPRPVSIRAAEMAVAAQYVPRRVRSVFQPVTSMQGDSECLYCDSMTCTRRASYRSDRRSGQVRSQQPELVPSTVRMLIDDRSSSRKDALEVALTAW